KSLNAYTLLQGAEEVPDKFEKEEYGVKNDVHNIVEEHSEVEHISDITHTEIDYLDLGNFIEHEIQELTAGAHIDGVANIIYQTHLLVCLDVTMVQSKTAKDIAELVITEIESGDDYSWNFKKADLSRKFGSTHRENSTKIPITRDECIMIAKSMTGQELFQRDNNHVESACKLLSEHEIHGFHWYLNIKDSEATAIGFTTPLLKEIKNRNISITEIYLDATYKTARGRYKLY
ncbi:11630_t:CDS:2, partial [Ambispora gerdemannii]